MTSSRLLAVCSAVLFLTDASAAFAQAPPVDQPERPSVKESVGTGLLRGLYVATPIVHAIDGLSTMRVIERGGREVNPLMAPQAGNGAFLAATKVGFSTAQVFLAHRVAKKHKFGAIAALTALNVGYAMVAAHNFRVARTLQAQATTIR